MLKTSLGSATISKESRTRAIDHYTAAYASFELNDSPQRLSCMKQHCPLYILVTSSMLKLACKLEAIIKESGSNQDVLLSVYYNLGVCSLELEDAGQAYIHFDKLLNLATSLNNEDQQVFARSKLSILFAERGEFVRSLECLEEGRALLSQVRIRSKVVFLTDEIKVFLKLNRINEVQDKLNILWNTVGETDLTKEKLEVLKLFKRYFKETDNFSEYVNYSDRYNSTYDSLIRVKDNIKLSVYEQLIHIQKEQDSLVIQGQNLQIKDKANEQIILKKERRLYQVIAIGSILLSFLVFSTIYLRKRIRLARERTEILKSEAGKLSSTLEVKTEQLRDLASFISQYREVLFTMKDRVNRIKNNQNSQVEIDEIAFQLSEILKITKEQENFHNLIESINEEFISELKLKYTSLTKNDIRLIILTNLNLSSKEIGALTNISPRSVDVTRYRLRKKLKLEGNESLKDLIQ